MADPPLVASVGLGWWGQVLAAKSEQAGLRVTTCFSPTEESRNAFAARFSCSTEPSLEAVLARDDVAGVLVATPHSTHAEIIEQCAAAGKHVFVEKPMTLTYAEGARAVDAAEAAGVVLQVGHMRRRQPATRRIKAMIEAGDLGMIHHVEANQSHPKGLDPRSGWRGDPAESPAGGMTGLGVHMVDNLIYLVGRPSRLAAFSRPVIGLSRLDDVTTVTFEFESGPLGYLGTATVVPDVVRTAAFGTEGAAWNEGDGAQFFVQRVGDSLRAEQPIDTIDAVVDELSEFAACLRGERLPETDGRAGLEVVAVLEAITTSAATGAVVELDAIRSTLSRA